MNRIADYFADTYREARTKFLAAVDKGGARLLSSHVNPARGPEGEECITDVAWIGPDDASVFVVSTGPPPPPTTWPKRPNG